MVFSRLPISRDSGDWLVGKVLSNSTQLTQRKNKHLKRAQSIAHLQTRIQNRTTIKHLEDEGQETRAEICSSEHPSLFPTVQSTALSVVRMSKMKEAHQHVNKSITKENKVITVTEVQEKRGA